MPDTDDTPSKAFVTVLDREIEIFQSTKPSGGFLALIHGLGVTFAASTPMAAHRKADLWRKREYNKIVPKDRRVPVPETATAS